MRATILYRPHGPSSKSQVARALGIARGTLYLRGKQAVKDKGVATAIEQWHEQDDTMGHWKLAALLKMGKNRVCQKAESNTRCCAAGHFDINILTAEAKDDSMQEAYIE